MKHREVTATSYNLLRQPQRLQVPVPLCPVALCFGASFVVICLRSLAFVHHHRVCCTGSTLTFEFTGTEHPGLTFDDRRATFLRHPPRIPKAILALTVRCKTRLHLIQAHKKCQTKGKNKSFFNLMLCMIKAVAHRFLCWEWHHGKVQITSLTSFTWFLLEIPRSCPADMKRITEIT